jgi:hypothetical protein
VSSPKITKYVVVYKWNGKDYTKEHDTMTGAIINKYELESLGMKPSVHMKN